MDDNTFWSNFGSNLKIAIRQASTYVLIAAGIALQALVNDPTVSTKVAGFLGTVGLGSLASYSGIIILVLGALAKAWPQVSVTKAVVENASPKIVAQVAADNAADASSVSRGTNVDKMRGFATSRMLAVLCAICIPIALAAQSGCTTTGTSAPSQASVDKAYLEAVILVDQVAQAATAAINADVLKGNDAENTTKAVVAARDGLKLAKTFTDPGAATAKINVTTATLTALQFYIAYARSHQPQGNGVTTKK